MPYRESNSAIAELANSHLYFKYFRLQMQEICVGPELRLNNTGNQEHRN
jgi:hypothetical protein